MAIINQTLVSGTNVPETAAPVSVGCHYNGTNFDFLTEQDCFNPTSRQLTNLPLRVSQILFTPKTLTLDMFGMHFNKVAASYLAVKIPIPENSYVGLARSHDCEVSWRQINTANGVYDWSTMDLWLSSVEARNMIPVYVVFGTPTWASARPAEASAYNVPGIAAEPASMTTLSTFLNAFIDRYGQRVKHFEVWNEVNGTGFYTGTKAALASIVETVATTVRARVTNSKIISPSVYGLKASAETPGVVYFREMLETQCPSTALLKNVVDIISFHSYPEFQRFIEIPEMVTRIRDVMVTAGIGSKPIWDTEVGILQSPKPPEQQTDEYYAIWMVRAQLYSILSGCEAAFWYGYDYGNGTGLTMGFHLRPKVMELRRAYLAQLVGKTVTSAGRLFDGRLCLATNNGTFIV